MEDIPYFTVLLYFCPAPCISPSLEYFCLICSKSLNFYNSVDVNTSKSSEDTVEHEFSVICINFNCLIFLKKVFKMWAKNGLKNDFQNGSLKVYLKFFL